MPKLTVEQAKTRVTLLLGAGSTVADAMKSVDRSTKTWENWRSSDPDFKAAVDKARATASRDKASGKDSVERANLKNLSFAEWRKRFLGRETYPHHQLWVDVLEGKEPTLWHHSLQYERNNPKRVLINCPPFHGKSTVLTQEYVTYRLCLNPSLRVMIISKTAEAASAFLFSIKTMMTDPEFGELQAAYAPPGGFKPQRGEGRWANNVIYLADRNLDAADKAAKDPSVTAVGIGGAVYGKRADLIILDDAVDDSNASNYEKQFKWLTRTVLSRNKHGIVALVGTRIQPQDLYRYVLNGDNYITGNSPWTVLKSPAVLEYAEDPKDWKTLWPRSTQPLDENDDVEPDADGLYPAWDGPALADARGDNGAMVWSLVYQQEDVSEDMTFHPTCVRGSVDGRRKPGPLTPGAWGHPKAGSEGMRVIGSIDPAGTGEAFMLVMAVDRATRERWVLNAWTGVNTTPSWYADRIEEITPLYGVHEWVIEQNGYASWIIHDERITRYCQQTGVSITPHYTGSNKQDPDFGVASMSSLFGALKRRSDGREESGQLDHDGNNIIHLPDPDKSHGIKMLIEQLVTWVPKKRGKDLRMDGPMCLWFAELRARVYTVGGDRSASSHAHSRFLSPRARRRQGVVPAGF
jgi:hypothetical protein